MTDSLDSNISRTFPRPLKIAEILYESVSLFRRDIGKYSIIVLIGKFPFLVGTVLSIGNDFASRTVLSIGNDFELNALDLVEMLVFTFLVGPTATVTMAARIKGTEPTVRNSYVRALRLLPRLFFVTFLLLSVTYLVSAIGFIPLFLSNYYEAGVAFFIPTLLLAIGAVVSVIVHVLVPNCLLFPVLAMEHQGSLRSLLTRLYLLPHGFRFRLACRILIVSLAAFCMLTVVVLFIAWLETLVTSRYLYGAWLHYLSGLIDVIIDLMYFPMQAAVLVMFYLDCVARSSTRTRKKNMK